MSYKPDLLEPDPLRLDEEWTSQPKLYHEVADELEQAKHKLRLAQLELEIAEAEASLEVRTRDPEELGLKSITEDVVKRLVVLDKRVRNAKEKTTTLEGQVGEASVKVRAAEHRKTALENLVQLKIRDYIAEPRMPKNNTDEKRREVFRKPQGDWKNVRRT